MNGHLEGVQRAGMFYGDTSFRDSHVKLIEIDYVLLMSLPVLICFTFEQPENCYRQHLAENSPLKIAQGKHLMLAAW